jgi:hypothetical protein
VFCHGEFHRPQTARRIFAQYPIPANDPPEHFRKLRRIALVRSRSAVCPVGLVWAAFGLRWSGQVFTSVPIRPNDGKRQMRGCSTSSDESRRAWGRRAKLIRDPHAGDPRRYDLSDADRASPDAGLAHRGRP